MRKLAFTLVELLIVVIILGILAAVVIPQFSDASEDARVSSLVTNLSTMRGQIELYKLQHGNYPPLATFEVQMTTKTNRDGSPGGIYGPYMQAIPNNPFTSPPDNDVTNTAAAATKAWYYDGAGVFRANDGGTTGTTPHANY